MVRSLNTDSCLMAINRFIARRGKPTTIICDKGTNFVGSTRNLKEYINSWNRYQITSEMAQKHIAWKFNHPGAPHFGGVLGTVRQCCKISMMAILGNRSFTDEFLTTTNRLVEQTLNARTITPASDDPADVEALTPNHLGSC